MFEDLSIRGVVISFVYSIIMSAGTVIGMVLGANYLCKKFKKDTDKTKIEA